MNAPHAPLVSDSITHKHFKSGFASFINENQESELEKKKKSHQNFILKCSMI